MNNSLYGSYLTRTFTDIYGTLDKFKEDYENNGIRKTISDESLELLYYLLYGRYGNSHIASSDENQFGYKLFSVIFMYGPSWEKRLDIQNKVRNLTEDELTTGSKAINNRAMNDDSAPSTSSIRELDFINEQNTQTYIKSKLDAYGLQWDLLATDVTEEFLSKFKKLFITFVSPQGDLWYAQEDING